MKLEEIAKQYAIACHNGTNHKYGDKDYTTHLQMVVLNAVKYIYYVEEEGNYRDVVLAACWLHDVIEDCRVTYNDVRGWVGGACADIVYALTNEKGKNRKERANEKYYQGIRDNHLAVFVKLCDRISNFEYSLMTQSTMAKMYSRENNDFCSSLSDGTDRYQNMFKRLQSLEKRAKDLA